MNIFYSVSNIFIYFFHIISSLSRYDYEIKNVKPIGKLINIYYINIIKINVELSCFLLYIYVYKKSVVGYFRDQRYKYIMIHIHIHIFINKNHQNEIKI